MKKQHTMLTSLFIFICAATTTQLTNAASESYSASAVYPTTVNCPAGQVCTLNAPIIIAEGTPPVPGTTQTKKK